MKDLKAPKDGKYYGKGLASTARVVSAGLRLSRIYASGERSGSGPLLTPTYLLCSSLRLYALLGFGGAESYNCAVLATCLQILSLKIGQKPNVMWSLAHKPYNMSP